MHGQYLVGHTKFGGSFSNILREIAIPILRREDCESSFPSISITPNMFCASLKGLDSCQLNTCWIT
ncbi:hypothetical protein Avbf_04240, partial [Armadillidium vulgare]